MEYSKIVVIDLNNKKYIVLLILSIMIVVIATMAVTYAYLSYQRTQEGTNTLSTGCFDLELTESSSINITSYPMSDTSGLNTTPYSFTFKNTCDTNTTYQVVLNIKSNTDPILLNYINYSLDGTTVNILSNANKIELPTELQDADIIASYILDTGTMNGTSESISHDLRIWISQDGGNDLMNKTFQAEIMIYGALNTENITLNQATITNLIPDGSFEEDESNWSGVVYSNTESLYGNQSSVLEAGASTTRMNTISMTTPIVNHVYYGRHSIKTDGNVGGADFRFEWFAGDGAGLNFVFGQNTGNHPDWYTESAIVNVTEVNGTSYVIRNFIVNPQATLWSDGLMIIDLTAAFGAGNEPSKEWCDENIPYFTGTKVINYSNTN